MSLNVGRRGFFPAARAALDAETFNVVVIQDKTPASRIVCFYIICKDEDTAQEAQAQLSDPQRKVPHEGYPVIHTEDFSGVYALLGE